MRPRSSRLNAGRYELATGQTMTVTIDGGQLKIQPTGGNAMTFLAESETRFFVREVSFVVESCATERATSRSSSSIRALARTA